jgi:hypothetical protein
VNYLDISGVGKWLFQDSQDSALFKTVITCIAATLQQPHSAMKSLHLFKRVFDLNTDSAAVYFVVNNESRLGVLA